jgi:hypothetical protein
VGGQREEGPAGGGELDLPLLLLLLASALRGGSPEVQCLDGPGPGSACGSAPGRPGFDVVSGAGMCTVSESPGMV